MVGALDSERNVLQAELERRAAAAAAEADGLEAERRRAEEAQRYGLWVQMQVHCAFLCVFHC